MTGSIQTVSEETLEMPGRGQLAETPVLIAHQYLLGGDMR